MERKILTRALAIVFAWTLVGCGDSNGDGTGGTGGSADTVSVDLSVVEFEPGTTDTPLEGAEVCVSDTTNCATSDADGMVTMEVPANSEIVFEVTATGYGDTLTPQTTTDQDVTAQLSPLLADSVVTLLAGILGTSYPFEGTGVIAISSLVEPVGADGNGIAGITYTPDQALTSYYLDQDEIPRLEATATAEPSGAGGFIEVAPGTYEVTLGGTASNCVVVAGWPGSGAGSVRLPVRAGFITQGIVTCDPVP
ncbi:MAG: hypothetical protein WAU39_07255 [Polyangiales bacterium]